MPVPQSVIPSAKPRLRSNQLATARVQTMGDVPEPKTARTAQPA